MDFPLPFSPTKKVTPGPISKLSSAATAGTEKGYEPGMRPSTTDRISLSRPGGWFRFLLMGDSLLVSRLGPAISTDTPASTICTHQGITRSYPRASESHAR